MSIRPCLVPHEVTDVRKVLQQAHLLVSQGWVQDHMAVQTAGYPCASSNPDACGWCLVGAVLRAEADLGSGSGWLALNLLRWNVADGEPVILDSWNDNLHRTKDDVVNLILNTIRTLPSFAADQ